MAQQSVSALQANAEAALQDQTNILAFKKLMIVFSVLSISLIVSYIDQSALGILLSSMGEDLDAQATISWAATSSMIANTTFQVLYGRLSDIFGRKYIYLSAVFLLFVSEILTSVARTSTQLYAFRGMAGVATGGINALTMIIVSDVVTLRNRGKYQGILGSCIGLGNTVAPFISAGIIKHTWRLLYWILGPCAFVCFVISFPFIPLSIEKASFKSKLKKIDTLGTILSSIFVIFTLIPVSSGGIIFAWNSALVISFLCIGGVAFLIFLYVEWKVSLLPMVPFRLLKNSICSALYIQIFFSGCMYYAQMNLVPVYYQVVMDYSVIVSAALTIPMVAIQAMTSVITGFIMTLTGKYGYIIAFGYFSLTVGTAIQLGTFTKNLNKGAAIVALGLQGIGIGCTFQPSLVALQANSAKADRAIVISVRGLIRAFGGAVGLAVASAILSNTLISNIPEDVPQSIRDQMQYSVYSIPDLSGLTIHQKDLVLDAYALAHRAVFIFYVPLMALSFGLCFWVQDTGLERAEEKREIPTELTDVSASDS
ncbi:major facilitator superfamily domain-containing protein [Lipomyces japonicus]|uniref:major facilitator superfamily domain-containing protein n=1 Tax=Lipomyces japonicus TaxID=56871 RepID=UPI0034CEB776